MRHSMRSYIPFGFEYGLKPQRDEAETRYFWTYSLKYCNNPIPHIFGSLPCCAGLHVSEEGIDPRDVLSLPYIEHPLVIIHRSI